MDQHIDSNLDEMRGGRITQRDEECLSGSQQCNGPQNMMLIADPRVLPAALCTGKYTCKLCED